MSKDIEGSNMIDARMRFSDKRIFDQILAASTLTCQEIDEMREDLETRIIPEGRLRLANKLRELRSGQGNVIPFPKR